MTQQILPECLSICEQGTWEPTTTNPDDDIFVSTGLYEAQDDNGNSYQVGSRERDIERWLTELGYQDTGDGIRYQREEKGL